MDLTRKLNSWKERANLESELRVKVEEEVSRLKMVF